VKQNFNWVKEQFADLLQLTSQGQKIYLVGGVVRDHLLERTKNDVDILCEKDSRSVARRWAEIKGGAFYIIDEQRNICRVITNESGHKSVYDFARQQGDTLLDDLSARDFTLNAMAIEFSDPEVLIDPLHGIHDIEQGILRACSRNSFTSDPIRTIRAVRYANAYQLNIEPDTFLLLKASVDALKNISGERKRDEFFKILDLTETIIAIKALRDTGILAELGLADISETNLFIAQYLADWLRTIENARSVPVQVRGFSYLTRLTKYFTEYKKLLTQKNTSDRNLHQLLILAALLIGYDVAHVREKAQKPLLSNEEISRLSTLIEYLPEIDLLDKRTDVITDRDYYLFFNQVDIAGLDLALLALVRQISGSDDWTIEKYAKLAENIFFYWFEKQKIVKPVLLLNGKDLMMNFDLSPGPVIGKLLDRLREEQAAGKIQTQEQALSWVEEQVNQIVDQRRWNRTQTNKHN